MAEATEATTTATETLTATAADASAIPTPGASDATPAPAKGETITVGTRQPSAFERATAALEKHAASTKDAPAEDAKDEKPAKETAAEEKPAKADGEADKPKDEKAEESKADDKDKKPEAEKEPEEKKEDPRLAKGLKLLVEREERARSIERRASTMLKEAEAKAASITAEYGNDVALVRSVRDLVAKGDNLGAVKALGINLKRAVELMSSEIEPSAEDVQRRIVREEFEAREAARKDADAKEAQAKIEREAATERVQQNEFLEKIFTFRDGQFVPVVDMAKYPFVARRNLNGTQLWDAQKYIANETGRRPTHTEVLDRLEKSIREDYEGAATLLKPAAAPAPSTPAPAAKVSDPPKPKAPEKVEKPAEQQSRKSSKRESASERAEAAMKRLGLQ